MPCQQHTATTPSVVIETRVSGSVLRRRRKCLICNCKFTTYEKLITEEKTFNEMVEIGPITSYPKMTALERKGYRQAANRATKDVFRAVRAGKLSDLNVEVILCVDCKKQRANCYDHRDYSMTLEVAPVCTSCNMKRGPADWSIKKHTSEKKNNAADH